MTARQIAVAAAADIKWLTNSASLLRRRLRYDADAARWWGLVRILVDDLGLTLKTAATVTTTALAGMRGRPHAVNEAVTGPARVEIDLPRYDSIFLANLSRALNHETPRRRGRTKAVAADPISAARDYGVDISLLQSSLARTPGERLALLDRNVEFLGAARRPR